MFLARVFVTLKPVVNDPQGLAIKTGLGHLGFDTVESVRAGKYLEITLTDADEASAQARVEQMCRQLLANPVIEDFHFEIEAAAPRQT